MIGKNMFCNQCEKETDGKNGFCLYCGEKLGKARQIIPESDLYENEKPTNKNKKSLIIISIVTMAVILFVSTRMASNVIKGYFRDSESGISTAQANDNEGYFRESEWGMSTEQVKAIEKSELIFTDPGILYYEIDTFPGFEGETTGVIYSFNAQDELTQGYYSLFFSESDIPEAQLMENLATEYEKIYGQDYAIEAKSFSWFTDKSYIRIFNVDEGGVIITFDKL
ncbi:MAG: hypothetical protein ACOH15_05790 [Acetobacterium sp.]